MLAYLFVLFAVAVRFMPHPLAFTPVAAALLYFGARGPKRQLFAPLALLAASDVILTKIVYAYPLTWDHFVTWAWYAAILWLGSQLRENSNWLRVGGSGAGQFHLIFRGQQFRRLGVLGHVSEDARRSRDLLRRRPAVLPPRNRRRHAVYRGDVRITRARHGDSPLREQAARDSIRLAIGSESVGTGDLARPGLRRDRVFAVIAAIHSTKES